MIPSSRYSPAIQANRGRREYRRPPAARRRWCGPYWPKPRSRRVATRPACARHGKAWTCASAAMPLRLKMRHSALWPRASGIPLRQHDHRAPATGRKPARIHRVVFRVERFHRRGEAQEQSGLVANLSSSSGRAWLPVEHRRIGEPLETEIGRSFVAEELVAVGDDSLVQGKEKFFAVLPGGGRFAADPRPSAAPLQTPFEWDAPRDWYRARSAGLPSGTSIPGSVSAWRTQLL